MTIQSPSSYNQFKKITQIIKIQVIIFISLNKGGFMKQLNKDTDFTQIIKTVRVFEKNNKLHLDYRINEKYVINGIERSRFSLGIEATKKNLQTVEKDIHSLALEHYLKINDIKNPNKIYLKDIAMEALDEEKCI